MQPGKARHPLWARGVSDAADQPKAKHPRSRQRNAALSTPPGRPAAPAWQQSSAAPSPAPVAAVLNPAANSTTSAATVVAVSPQQQPSSASDSVRKQFMCRMHIALLDACYHAVLMHRELQQQGMMNAPAPVFPMEKLLDGFKERLVQQFGH